MEYREEESDGSLIWFLAGLALGVAVAILYAPRPGIEIREFLQETADEALDLLAPHSGWDSSEVLDEAADMVGGAGGAGGVGGPAPAAGAAGS